MKALPPGQFEQGAAAGTGRCLTPRAAAPPGQHHLPGGLGVYEITVGEFREFTQPPATRARAVRCMTASGRTTPSSMDNAGFTQTALHL